MPGKFELFKDKGGNYRFRLKATNGQIILASQGYRTKVAATNGIGSFAATRLKKAASNARMAAASSDSI